MTRWSAAEDEFIVETPQLTTAQVAVRLGRTRSAVACRRALVARRTGVRFRVNNDPFKVGDRPLLARTCLDCGVLLEARLFGRDGESWRSTCTPCRVERHPPRRERFDKDDGSAERANAKLQAATLPAPRHRFPWLEDDHAVLADPDLTTLQKALRLGRTYMATASAVYKNGYRSATGSMKEQGVWVIDNPHAPQQVAA